MKYKAKRLYDCMGNLKGYEYRGYKIKIYAYDWGCKEYGIRELSIFAYTLKEAKRKLDERLDERLKEGEEDE